MGCGASRSSSSGWGGGEATAARDQDKRDAIEAFVAPLLTQPVYFSSMQEAIQPRRAEPGAEEEGPRWSAESNTALAKLTARVGEYCDLDAPEPSKFHARTRAALTAQAREDFAALRLDPTLLAAALMATLRQHPQCFPQQLATAFTRLAERPGGIEALELPPPPVRRPSAARSLEPAG